MKIIDNKGKLFGKISIIDIVIVLSILFVATVFVMNSRGKVEVPVSVDSTVEYTTVLKAYNLNTTAIEPFTVGDNVYSSSGELIGKITDIDVKQGYTKEKLQNGTYIDFPNPEYLDYFLTIEGTGTLTDKGFKAQGSFSVVPNDTIKIASKVYYGNVVVLSVEKSV